MRYRLLLFGLLLGMMGCEPTNTAGVVATVHVVDAVTGRPIPQAQVLLVSVYARNGLGAAYGDSLCYTHTDAHGQVRATFAHAF
ncbi:hypothetical protein [Hymenobacter crusticola]|uniref:Big-1 domain-containing protein n=1 Tax=Hymenobacter crusticola TaxID=1770526 RepID=A0A243W568_9BACT|nr:hypothetical protein [Hymenobacter crusticola]OUJ67193.1 hypothetical protein BXP70_28925 [Hymenobacter crusticola]